MQFENVEDIWASAAALGKASGRSTEAQNAIQAAQRDLRDLAVDFKDAPHPKVLYLVDSREMFITGSHTYIDQMITLAGGTNAGADAGTGYVSVSRETMVKLVPDVFLIGAPDEIGAMDNDPRLAPWMTLPVPAARNKRIYLVTDGNSLMPSLNIAKNVRQLASLIHRADPLPEKPVTAIPGATPGGTPGNGGNP
jgi:iron complex transport system substrate-binding protein